MTRKKKNVALAYLITILTTFVLVGGTAVFLYSRLSFDKDDSSSSSSSDEIPIEITSEQNQTLLFVLDSGSQESDAVFVVARFLAPDKKLILVPVQGDTFSQINTEKSTVYDFYRKGGVIKAATAIENALDIKIQKYMKFDKQAFQSFCDIFGGVNVFIPYDLIYENQETGESVVIRSGQQYLDGIRLRQMATYPEFKEGEEYRSKILGVAVTDMINKSLGERLYNTLDASFNAIINQGETNITAYDYKFRKDAMLNMIVPGEVPAQFTLCTGTYNEDKQFVIDSAFKDNLKTFFLLEEPEE